MELFSPEERNRHIYIIGKTRSGKSTFQKSIAIDDIRNDKCVIFIDPHGHDVLDVLDAIPPSRHRDVCYLDFTDPDYAVAFSTTTHPQHTLSAIHAIWEDSWGPRLAWLLINGLYVLFYNKGTTWEDLPPLYYDRKHRQKLTQHLPNAVVHRFWHKEFPSYTDKVVAEAQGAILNKIGQFLAIPQIHRAITQRNPRLDIRQMIAGKKIILLNLSKGTVGDEGASLYGALFLSALKHTVMSGPAHELNLFVDEFQSFGSSVFAPLLSETAKFGLNACLAHQFLNQLPEKTRSAILGNVGSTAVFTVGPEDADILARHYDRDTAPFNPRALMNQDPFHAYLRKPGQEPFSISVDPPEKPYAHRRLDIIEQSRRRYARRA